VTTAATTPVKPKQPTPSIAVTATLSIELEEKEKLKTLGRRTKPLSPSKRRELKRRDNETVHLQK
jgi:hypothetical protein